MHAELHALLTLQQKDTHILEAERQLAHHQQRTEQVQQQLKQAVARNQQLHEALNAKRLEGKRLSQEVDHLDQHLKEQERKLAHDIVSFKEIELIKQSLEHGHQHIDQLEEQAIAMLNEIEEQAVELEQKDRAFSERRAQLEAELAHLALEIDAQRQALSQARAERDGCWTELPEHLQAAYGRLRLRFPDPVVALRGQNCGGCQLHLSVQLMGELRQGNSVVHCEHCQRILYLP